MTATILLSAHERHHANWIPGLRYELGRTGLDAEVTVDVTRPRAIDYIVLSPDGPIDDFTPFENLRAVLNMWAGVEYVVNNRTLAVPLARMVDPGMIEGMTEWITGQVLRHHLGMDQHINNTGGVWLKSASPPLARDRTVGILGLGVLGTAAAHSLASLNFGVIGWRKTGGDTGSIRVVNGGPGLDHILSTADIIVLQLPLTRLTENLLDRDAFSRMKPGMFVINSGRGGLIDDDALLEAIDAGIVAHATLDVFREEPLPPHHPFWTNPRVSVWPHIASETRVETATKVLVENIALDMSGRTMNHLVDRGREY